MTNPRMSSFHAGDEAVRHYLDGIGRYELLTAEDEVLLAKAMERGRQAEAELADVDPSNRELLLELVEEGLAARRRFIQSNLRLVVSIAKRYQKSGLPFLDLVQEGNLGLIRAVEKFEYRKTFKFSTYATWWVRQAISRAVAETGRTIRVPVHMMDTISRVHSAEAELLKRNARAATDAEIAQEAGLTIEKVAEAKRFAPETISIFEPVGQDNSTLGDFIEDPDAVDPFEFALLKTRLDELNRVLDRLSDREREVIVMRYGLYNTEPKTLDELGTHYRVTRERVRQIETRALAKLRRPSSGLGRTAAV